MMNHELAIKRKKNARVEKMIFLPYLNWAEKNNVGAMFHYMYCMIFLTVFFATSKECSAIFQKLFLFFV